MPRLIASADIAALGRGGDTDLDAQIAAVESAYRELGEGTARLLGRQSLNTDPDPDSPRPRSYKVMGAALLQSGVMGVVTYPAGYGRPLDFRISLSSAQTGELFAIIEGETVTQWATAAVTAVATRCLAAQDARVLGLIGTGTFAFDQPRFIARVRALEEVRCYSRDPEKRDRFAARLAQELPNIKVRAVDSAEAAAESADILTTVTTSHSPVIPSAAIPAACHVNAIGMHYPKTREIDSETLQRGSFFVDDVAQTLEEKGEFLIPLAEGIVSEDHIRGDLGSLASGKIEGRRSPEELTIFGSGGTAIEYIGIAVHLLEAAEKAGVGTPLLGGRGA